MSHCPSRRNNTSPKNPRQLFRLFNQIFDELEEDEALGSITVHRKITEIEKLYDVSAVSLPANDATEISARNLCDGLIAEVKEERLADEARKRTKNQIAIMAEMI